MRNNIIVYYFILLLSALMINIISCSIFSAPSDAEVLKAIDDSGILKTKSFTVTSPPVIVARGDRNKDGSWPVKVKMTLTMQMPNGKISEPKENTTTFRIYKNSGGAAPAVWRAVLGS